MSTSTFSQFQTRPLTIPSPSRGRSDEKEEEDEEEEREEERVEQEEGRTEESRAARFTNEPEQEEETEGTEEERRQLLEEGGRAKALATAGENGARGEEPDDLCWENLDRSRSSSVAPPYAATLPDQIHLNIGGRFFYTSLATLTFAGGSTSFFASMFSGRFPIIWDKQDRIFIDRDGTYFRYILNYLRDGGAGWKASDLDLNLKQLKQLHKEARFYNIIPLKNKLAAHIVLLKQKEVKKCHVTIVDGDRYYVSLAVELFLANGFVVNGYTGTASSNSKWVSVLLRGNRFQFMSNLAGVSKLRAMLVSGHLVTEFFAQIDEKDNSELAAYGLKMPSLHREVSASQLSIYSNETVNEDQNTEYMTPPAVDFERSDRERTDRPDAKVSHAAPPVERKTLVSVNNSQQGPTPAPQSITTRDRVSQAPRRGQGASTSSQTSAGSSNRTPQAGLQQRAQDQISAANFSRPFPTRVARAPGR
eukprot:gb/GEZN01005225.1/.p1 GENE.gb/GEZN01005225.1/~~gb/GEZN01005225.1/.p1  ORF type:complete len:476 (-),score=86.17 gb/GEZN01005225.1/:101-1528(-)